MRKRKARRMRNEFTAIVERDGPWHIAYCAEIPGANGQGRTKTEALRSLADAIALILEDRRKDGLRGVPDSAIRERESSSGEAGRPASPPEETRVPSEAGGPVAFALDQPSDRRGRGGAAPHGDIRRPRPEDLPRAVSSGDRQVSGPWRTSRSPDRLPAAERHR